MKVIKIGLKYFKPYLAVWICCIALGMVAQALGLFLPKLIALIVDFGLDFKGEPLVGFNPFVFLVNGNFGDGGSFRLLTTLCIAFVLLLSVKHISVYARNNLLQWQGMLYNKKLRFAAMEKMFAKNLPLSAGAVYTHLNNDTINIKELFVSLFPLIVDNFTIVAFGFFLIGGVNPYLMFVPLVAVPLIVFVSFSYMKHTKIVTKRSRQCVIDINYNVNENLSNINLVKQFGREEYESVIFRGYNRRLKEAYISQNRVSTRYAFIFNCIRAFSYVAAVVLGSLLVINHAITIGNFVEIITYVYLILDGINAVMNQLFVVMQLQASGNRYVEFMQSPNAFEAATTPVKLKEKATIEINGLTVTDKGKKLIKNITTTIPFGKKVGITGDIGSGKSVLLKALNHFFALSEGNIAYGGVDIKDIPLFQLRDNISQLFEERYITDGSIRDNIVFGNPNASEELVNKCLEACLLFADLKANNLTLDTNVNGLELSDQTKQLIGVARALVYDKNIYLLDQPLGGVDSRLRKKLSACLMKYLDGKTVVVATLSPDILRKCDEILYLENGEIMEKGTHRSLLAAKDRYYQHHKKLAQAEEMQKEQERIKEEMLKEEKAHLQLVEESHAEKAEI